MNKKFNELKRGIKSYFIELQEKYKNENINYKVFYSKMSFEADILFIGINPGAGEPDCEYVEPEDTLEYLLYDYRLAKDTLEVFNKAGYPDLLKNLDKNNKVVKINLYYLVTTNLASLYEFLNRISPEDKKVFIEKSIFWTNKFIELCNPKIIIYEGKESFQESPPFGNQLIAEYYSDSNDVYELKYKNYNPILLGFKRMQHSGLKNKEAFAKILKRNLDKIYNI